MFCLRGVHGLLRGKEGAAKWIPNWKHWEKSLTQGEAIVSNQLSSLNYFCAFFNCCALLTQCLCGKFLLLFVLLVIKFIQFELSGYAFSHEKEKNISSFVLFSFAVLDKYLEVILLVFSNVILLVTIYFLFVILFISFL